MSPHLIPRLTLGPLRSGARGHSDRLAESRKAGDAQSPLLCSLNTKRCDESKPAISGQSIVKRAEGLSCGGRVTRPLFQFERIKALEIYSATASIGVGVPPFAAMMPFASVAATMFSKFVSSAIGFLSPKEKWGLRSHIRATQSFNVRSNANASTHTTAAPMIIAVSIGTILLRLAPDRLPAYPRRRGFSSARCQ
jgi:hypothetical protein